jgi:pSer/pThr/pTyr-binding forkhead associated (FHA) protein
MKLSLVVRTPGPGEGKTIPIALPQFLIGRDPQCHLRPKSDIVSKRHCAFLVRDEGAFVRDFDSTNGTFLNDEPVKGERELRHQDRIKIGPLVFEVALEGVPVKKPVPVKVTAPSGGSSDDDSVAAMLMSMDDGEPSPPSPASDGVPAGTTIMDIASPLSSDKDTTTDNPKAPDTDGPAEKKEKPKPAMGNTSNAAKAILEKYTRRQRS